MNYDEWLATVPEAITNDPLWNLKVYRLAVFAADIGWQDVTKLIQDKRTLGLSDQLFRALGSIGGNVSEGYSRGSGKDRARFYEYGLGSSRESRHWYYTGRHVLGEKVIGHRLSLLSEVARLLLTMLPAERADYLHESELTEQSRLSDSLVALPVTDANAAAFCLNVPMP